MDQLRAARRAGKRVEIGRHVGGVSGTLSAAQESARHAAEANARGRVARIIVIEHGQRVRELECGVNFDEMRELIGLGAVEV